MVKEKVVIIIPTYNEVEVIAETISQVFQTQPLLDNHELNILIFDSASTDGTEQEIESLQSQFPLLHLQSEPKKSGLGSAYLQAMRFAISELKADIIFEFDADLSHQPQYIPPMLELLANAEVVVGSRYVKGGSIPSNWGLRRKFFSIIGNAISRLLLTFKYKDFTSGFRATRSRSLAKVLPTKFLSSNYAYKLQLLWLLHKAKVRILEFPIEFIDREKGVSKLPKNSIKDSLRVLFILRFSEFKSYFNMCMVGLIGTAIQFMLYNILRFHLSLVQSSQIAVFAALTNNYILNSKFTFKSKLKSSAPQESSWLKRLKKRLKYMASNRLNRFIGFVGYSLIMMWLQSTWLHWAVERFGAGLVKENIIIAIGIAIGSLLNYFTYTRHIWPESRVIE